MLIGTALLIAALAAEQEDGFRPPRATCPQVEIQATGEKPDANDLRPARRPAVRTFSAATAGDLEITLTFSRPGSLGRTILNVYTPQGHLYQQLPVATATSRGRRAGSARLPVSGTLIVQSSLYGRWKIETQLDGSSRACGSPVPFDITP